METLKRRSTSIGTAMEHLPSGRIARITAWTVGFPPASPNRLPPGTLAKTHTDKPLVQFAGEPLCGELAIARSLHQDGWAAVWADTFHGQKFWSGMPHQKSPVDLPADVRRLYDGIAETKGSASGCFDVIAWKNGRTIWLEYKGPNDRPNKNEPFWIDAALQAGVREEDLFFVGDSARPSTPRAAGRPAGSEAVPVRGKGAHWRSGATQQLPRRISGS
jgi:hypothetical protein